MSLLKLPGLVIENVIRFLDYRSLPAFGLTCSLLNHEARRCIVREFEEFVTQENEDRKESLRQSFEKWLCLYPRYARNIRILWTYHMGILPKILQEDLELDELRLTESWFLSSACR